MFTHKTTSNEQAKRLAFLFAKEIIKSKFSKKSALIIALSGNLGSAKTTFVQGFLRGAGIKKKITSPTFVLIKTYKLTNLKTYKLIHHIDCYRIKNAKELFNLGLEKILSNSKNIVLIEWPGIIKKYLPKSAIWIKFKYGRKESERIIKISE